MNMKEKQAIKNWNVENTKKGELADFKFFQMQEICKENNLVVYCNMEQNLKSVLECILKFGKSVTYRNNELTLENVLDLYKDYVSCKSSLETMLDLIHEL